MSVDEILDSCADSRAEDWAFWVYLCGDADARGTSQAAVPVQERDLESCARAVYLSRPAIGLAWTPALEDETAALPAFSSDGTDPERLCHWVELLYQATAVDRHLAVWVDGARAYLPVPSAETSGDGSATLWVSRRAHRLIRLANEVDPDCSDFDEYFAASGIQLLREWA